MISNCSLPTQQDVLDVIQQHHLQLQQFGVRKLGLFGSFVRGEQQPDSDIDWLVEFEEGQKTFDNFMQLSFWLEDVFQRRIELVTAESLSPYLRPHIAQEVQYVTIAA